MTQPTVVIGGSVDALVAAHLLERMGQQVLLVSQADEGPESGWVPAQILKALDLQVEMQPADPWICDGAGLELSRDMAKSVASIRRLSAGDAERWPQFCARMAHLAAFLEDVYLQPAREPTSLGFALKLRRLGRAGMQDLLRVLPMPAADLLDDWFEGEALKGLLGAAAVRHLCHGPRSGGSAFTLLHQHVGNPPGVFRFPRSNLNQLLLARSSVALRRERVSRIVVRAGRAVAVVLQDGEEIAAAQVVSGLPARRTLLELADPGWLDPDLARAIGNIRSRPVAARVDVKLDRPPPFTALALAPSLDYVERAYDDVKYRRFSADPVIEVCAQGSQLEVHVQYVPHGFTEAQPLGERVRQMLNGHLGGAAIVGMSVRLPSELRQHAELALDQALWMRPIPELARGRTPIEGLWLCGPDLHPGPGVLGASAYHCVKEMSRA
jgi:phytoene dehydrogenase-like protein